MEWLSRIGSAHDPLNDTIVTESTGGHIIAVTNYLQFWTLYFHARIVVYSRTGWGQPEGPYSWGIQDVKLGYSGSFRLRAGIDRRAGMGLRERTGKFAQPLRT